MRRTGLSKEDLITVLDKEGKPVYQLGYLTNQGGSEFVVRTKMGLNSENMENMESERKTKKVSDSLTEVTKLLQYKDINGYDRLFGGRLMEWIDEAAGIAALRHCGGEITTACVDTLQFKHAAYLHDLVVIIAKVTYVGRTSMEVRVDSYVEDCKTGMRYLINHAYLTEVHVDSSGKPLPIEYGLELTNEVERAEWEGARKRIAVRKTRQAEGF